MFDGVGAPGLDGGLFMPLVVTVGNVLGILKNLLVQANQGGASGRTRSGKAVGGLHCIAVRRFKRPGAVSVPVVRLCRVGLSGGLLGAFFKVLGFTFPVVQGLRVDGWTRQLRG